MSELQIYCCVMFWFGVILTRIIFHVEKKWKEKQVYEEISLSLIRFLSYINLLEISKILEESPETDPEEYTKILESNDMDMSTFTQLMLSAFSARQRSKLAFTSWDEVKKISNHYNKTKERGTNND